MANRVTQDDIRSFNELYFKTKNFSEVARITGFSAGTVRKYVDRNWKPVDETKIVRFSGDVPSIDFELFSGVAGFGELCVLSEEENNEIIELWKELED